MTNSIVARVIFSRGDKTLRVAWNHYHDHPKYPLRIRRTSQLLVHDEEKKCIVGDIILCTPSPQRFSKNKVFKMTEILRPVPRATDAQGVLHGAYDGGMIKNYKENIRHWKIHERKKDK